MHGDDLGHHFRLLGLKGWMMILLGLIFTPTLQQVDAAAPATMIGYLLLSGVALGALRYCKVYCVL